MRGEMRYLTWKLGKHTTKGTPQWQAFATIDGQSVKFVLDRDSPFVPTESGQLWLSEEGGTIHRGGLQTPRVILAKAVQRIEEKSPQAQTPAETIPIDRSKRIRNSNTAA